MKRQSTSANASRIAAPLAEILVGGAPVSVEFWDGSSWGSENPIATIRLRSKEALKRILWAPGELGVARAFVAGEDRKSVV